MHLSRLKTGLFLLSLMFSNAGHLRKSDTVSTMIFGHHIQQRGYNKGFSARFQQPPSKSTPYSSLFTLGAVMAFATGLANTSLQHNSVGFYQMAKIAVTPTIVLTEFIFFRRTIYCNKVLALAVVSIGVVVATVTDLELNFFGACITIAWIIPSAVNKILWSNLQQQSNWTALALMWKITPITIFVWLQWDLLLFGSSFLRFLGS